MSGIIEEVRRAWETAHLIDHVLLTFAVSALLFGMPVMAMLAVLVMVFAWGARGDVT